MKKTKSSFIGALLPLALSLALPLAAPIARAQSAYKPEYRLSTNVTVTRSGCSSCA